MGSELIGYIATVLSIVAFFPQVAKAWKTKSTKDISFPMYFIFTVSQAIWLTYGILITSWPVVVANVTIFLLALSILLLKLKYG